MKVTIFNNTRTVDLDDNVVKTYTEITGTPVDTKCVEHALFCDGIKSNTDLDDISLAKKVIESLQMDIEVANDIAEGKVGPRA